MTATKPKIKKIDFSKDIKTAENEVKLFYKFVKFMPFEITNKRVRGWEKIKEFDSETLVARAIETITPSDIFVLTACIKAYQEIGGIESNDYITLNIDYTKFAKEYIGMHDKAKLNVILERLFSFHVIYSNKETGEKNAIHCISDFKIDRKNVMHVKINKHFADACNNQGWVLNFDNLKNISKPTARTLYMYLSANGGTEFYQRTFENILDLDNTTSAQQSDNRYQINSALKELIKYGIITDWSFDIKTKKYFLSKEPKKQTPVPVAPVVLPPQQKTVVNRITSSGVVEDIDWI